MTPSAQRILIASACGWKNVSESLSTFMCDGKSMNVYGTNPAGDRRPAPRYLQDLNAMHEAEKGVEVYNQGPDGIARFAPHAQ